MQNEQNQPEVFQTPPPQPASIQPVPELPHEKHSNLRYLKEKYVYIPLLIIILIPIIGVIVANRYTLLGLVFKQNYSAIVIDGTSRDPLIGATLNLGNQTLKTNRYGEVEFSGVKVGYTQIQIAKTNYASFNGRVLVPYTNHNLHIYYIQPLGPEIPIAVNNYVNNVPIESAIVSLGDNVAVTNNQGVARVVLGLNSKPVSGTLSALGYLNGSVSVDPNKTNNFRLVPNGSVYYLAQAGGAVNVMKANLDGSSQQIVFAGTPSTTKANTSMYVSSDLKYIAVFTTRDASGPSFYIIDTSSGKAALVEQNPYGYKYVGWTSQDKVVYEFIHDVPDVGAYNGTKLVSYDATTTKKVTLDTTDQLGFDQSSTNAQTIGAANVLGDGTVLYTKTWSSVVLGEIGQDKTTFNSVNSDGTMKTTLLSLNAQDYPNPPTFVQTLPVSVSLAFMKIGGTPSYYTYTAGKFTQSTSGIVAKTIASPPNSSNYYDSPSGSMTMWATSVSSGSRLIDSGDPTATKVLSSAKVDQSYTPYGWSSDKYLVLMKDGNSLYVMPSSGANSQKYLQKVVDVL